MEVARRVVQSWKAVRPDDQGQEPNDQRLSHAPADCRLPADGRQDSRPQEREWPRQPPVEPSDLHATAELHEPANADEAKVIPFQGRLVAQALSEVAVLHQVPRQARGAASMRRRGRSSHLLQRGCPTVLRRIRLLERRMNARWPKRETTLAGGMATRHLLSTRAEILFLGLEFPPATVILKAARHTNRGESRWFVCLFSWTSRSLPRALLTSGPGRVPR